MSVNGDIDVDVVVNVSVVMSVVVGLSASVGGDLRLDMGDHMTLLTC